MLNCHSMSIDTPFSRFHNSFSVIQTIKIEKVRNAKKARAAEPLRIRIIQYSEQLRRGQLFVSLNSKA